MSEEQPHIWSVSQLTRRVKGLLETEISYVWVAGEISNFRVSPAGHAYFTLKDKESQIDVVMFRGKLMTLRFGPENGIEVIAYGLVSVYEKRGAYQIVCDEMQPKGMGALQLAFEKLKKKLDEEGLSAEEHKNPIPLFPKRIGVVTSPTGAAIRDILNVIRRRFANVHILLCPARVQGEEAPEEIVSAIAALERWGGDVMIVGRGGGSVEDLWAFNEEIVVRAIHEAKTPIISAVGHEIDFTLSDFAADLRAPTPSAAAELVVQEREAIITRVAQLRQDLARSIEDRLARARHRLRLAQSSYFFLRPEEIVRERRQQADELRLRLQTAMTEQRRLLRTRLDRAVRSLPLLSPLSQVRRVRERLAAMRQRLVQGGRAAPERFRARLRPLETQLDALSPLAILGRGYALAWKLPEHVLVREAAQLAPGDTISLKFGKGGATAAIDTLENNGG